MLVVTGAQRSGTTFLAGYLRLLGYDMGSDFFHEDIDGGFEHPDICWYYRDKLQDAKFPFSDFDEAIGKNRKRVEFDKIKNDCVKFSFLLMNPRFIEIWKEGRGFGNDKFIIMVRDPAKVVRSKQRSPMVSKRFSTDSDLLKLTAEELGFNMWKSLSLLLGYGADITLIPFPGILEDPSYLVKILMAKLSIDYLNFFQLLHILKDHINPDKVHIK